MTRLLIVPGLHDSGPTHWQSWLEHQVPDTVRVEQDNWIDPDLPRWNRRLALYLEREAHKNPKDKVIVVAHSFGCLAALAAAPAFADHIKGLLLVAPADPAHFASCEGAFHQPLPLRSLVIASSNDAWMSLDRAYALASDWGSKVINLGYAGHINVNSGFGPWPGVFDFLEELDGLDEPSPFRLIGGHPNRADERFRTLSPVA